MLSKLRVLRVAARRTVPRYGAGTRWQRAFSVASTVDPNRPDPAAILRPAASDKQNAQQSLSAALPDLPNLKPASQLAPPQTEVTTLSTGLRVISQETYGQSATVGIFIDTGSRYEQADEVGVTHFLEHLAFKSTSSRSHAQLVHEIEDIGALTTSTGGREQVIYTVDVLRDNVDRAVELLADTVLHAQLVPDEVEAIKSVLRIQTEDLMENPQAMLQEYIHLAAYGADQPLGRPMQCPLDKVDAITMDKVEAFRRKHFVADKMVLAGAGIDHARLVKLAEQSLAKVPQRQGQEDRQPVPANYRGGLHTIPNADSTFSHVAIAFPVGGWHDEDLVPVCVLHTLLGGGDSFSAGGPGKGMYSRLYTSVLNRFYWVESAFAFSSIYEDVGLLGIYGASAPTHTSNLVALLCNQLLALVHAQVDEVELARAKNQLKSSVLMNLESRMILYEDIGRQLLTYGEREPPEKVCAKIDKVTLSDLQRVLQQCMAHAPSLVYSGDMKLFPQYDDVVRGLNEGLRMK